MGPKGLFGEDSQDRSKGDGEESRTDERMYFLTVLGSSPAPALVFLPSRSQVSHTSLVKSGSSFGAHCWVLIQKGIGSLHHLEIKSSLV